MRSWLVVAGVLAVAGCGQAGVGSPTDVTPPVATNESSPPASTTAPPDECGDVPGATLESEIDVCGTVPSSSDCPPDQDRSDTEGNAEIDWVDFVRLGGRLYDRSRASTLEPSALGDVVGQVCFTVVDVVSNPSYRLADGDASFLPVGTELRAFGGADPGLRVAAVVDGQVIVYEVSMVEGASTGGELIDLTSPITEIRVNATSGGGPLRTIVDGSVIASLVESLRVAPVVAEFDPGSESSPQYSVELVRADGTVTARTFVVETAMMWPGIALPTAWVEAVQHAVGEVTVVAVHDDFSFYGPCGDNSVDVFGTTYFQLYAEEVEVLDESRYPQVEGDANEPAGFARVAPPGPGDDVGTLIVYSDGMARYESDSGIVEWLTTEAHTYNWVC